MTYIITILVMAGIFYLYSKKEAQRKKSNALIENNEKPSWLEVETDETVIIAGKKSSSLNWIEWSFFMALFFSLFFIVDGIIGRVKEIAIIGFVLLIPALYLGLLYSSFSKTEIFVTSHRIYGAARFGKRVNLPIDSITAVGTSVCHGIDVSTPSGYIRFKFIENNIAVQSAVSKLLNNRQSKAAAPATQNIINTPVSDADELKKFKELLDSGIITQEEFDEKKKQLLGL